MIEPLLQGLRILICRTEPKASELCKVFESMGADARALPCIDIEPIPVSGALKTLMYDLDQFKKIIVVSQHAASLMIEQLDEFWPQVPVQQDWFAIGRASSDILAKYGLNVHAPESDLTSEALLEANALQNVKGEKILIVKGEAGRSKLEQGLRERGAKVSTLELYRRTLPVYSDQHLNMLLNEFSPNYVVALSNDTINNLNTFVDQVGAPIKSSCVIVPSLRVAEHANRLGYTDTRVSERLKPIDLIRAIRKRPH